MPSQWYAGIDWSSTTHDLAVINHVGELVVQARVPDDAAGVAEVVDLLKQVAGRRRKQVRVGIEKADGLFVGALRKAGQPIVVVNPTQLARYRGRLSASRKKSDPGDARLIAHVLRVDGASHRPLPEHTPLLLAIREVARAQHGAVADRKQQLARLDGLLREYYPNMRQVCAGLSDGLAGRQAQAVLRAAPTPAGAARLTPSGIAELLERAGRRKNIAELAQRVYDLLRTPALRQPRAVEEAMGQRVLSHLRMIEAACSNAAVLADQLDILFGKHPQAPIYISFPGLGPLLAGRLLSELGDDPDRFVDARALRAYAGATPLTWASGSSCVVRRRRHVGSLLLTTCHLWAWAALKPSPGARGHYDRRRAAGDRHPTALRHLSARLLGQLHHCLRTGELYCEDLAYPAGGGT